MVDEAQQGIAGRIKAARKAAGLSAENLAQRISVSRDTIYNWEHGVGEPGASQVQQIADATGKPVTFFFVSEQSHF